MLCAAIIVAAGRGVRAGGDQPKQFVVLGSKAVLLHSVDAFLAHGAIASVYVVAAPDMTAQVAELCAGRPIAGIVAGGAERQHSVRAGLEAALAGGATRVLVHDAARPLVPLAVIDRLIAALDDADGAVPGLPVADTLARRDDAGLGPVVDRDGLLRIQTPQAFAAEVLRLAHDRWTGAAATDDAQMVRAQGGSVAVVPGDPCLEKITHPGDLDRLAATVPGRVPTTRTGLGFDVHRLESRRPLWLCGVLVPHDKGLAGHSDADVGLHALVDAILGALGAGDIGTHFPPSDPQWKGAESWRFVRHARALADARGAVIDHVDITLICEAPKIGPHRARMITRIAELLGIDGGRVSVKATTTEQLGFTGRGEGIAAQAVATLRF